MAYIYQADIYCNSCGEVICDDLTIEDRAPADPDDEFSFNSDQYPKQVRDDKESDYPQNCSEGKHCLEAEILSGGQRIGKQMGSLTRDGVKYLKNVIAKGGEVAEFWAEHYEAYLQ